MTMALALTTQDAGRSPVVSIINGEAIASSRDVAQYFGKRHDHVLQAIRTAKCSAEFRARNYAETKVLERVGATERMVPVIDMTRNGFAFVVLAFTGEKAGALKEAYILQFDAMEAELRRQSSAAPMVPQTLSEALRLAADLAEENERHKRLLIEVQPKAKALDRIAETNGSMCVTDAAKALQMRPKDLFDFMRSNRWLYRRGGSARDQAFEDKRQAGLLEHRVTEEGWTQVRVTKRGLTHLAQTLTAREPARLV